MNRPISPMEVSERTLTQTQIYGYGSLAVFLICIISILGIILFPFIPKRFHSKATSFMCSLAVGALAGDALFHLIPIAYGIHSHDDNHTNDSSSKNGDMSAIMMKTTVIISGIYVFYLLDVFLTMILSDSNAQHFHHHHHHHHELGETAVEIMSNDIESLRNVPVSRPSALNRSKCKEIASRIIESIKTTKSFGWSVLIGDTFHNFADGIAIGAAFASSSSMGITTSLAIVLHEIPHELGDYAIMLQAGFSHRQALVLNIATALTSFIGLFIGIAISTSSESALSWILAFTAGVFLYISLTDIFPLIIPSGRSSWRLIVLHNFGLFIGFAIMFLIAYFEEQIHHLID